MDDANNYIQTLSLSQNGGFIGAIDGFENETNQDLHAMDVKVGMGGIWWDHVLFYDKDNKRIKVIRNKTGGYRS